MADPLFVEVVVWERESSVVSRCCLWSGRWRRLACAVHTDYEGAQRAVDIIHGVLTGAFIGFLFGLLSFVDPLVLGPDPAGTGG